MLHQNMNYNITSLTVELLENKNLHMISFCSIAMAFVSSTSPITTFDNDSETDLNVDDTEDELHMDISNWTHAQKEKVTTHD